MPRSWPGRAPTALGLLLVLAAAPAGRAATVTVTIQDVESGRGHVRIGVCGQPDFLSEVCAYHAIVSAQAGRVTARIADVPPGIYAVDAYHDATDAGHLRRGLFGVPKDGFGFSRDPAMRFGPPSFRQCAVRIGPGDAAITITLRYPGR